MSSRRRCQRSTTGRTGRRLLDPTHRRPQGRSGRPEQGSGLSCARDSDHTPTPRVFPENSPVSRFHLAPPDEKGVSCPSGKKVSSVAEGDRPCVRSVSPERCNKEDHLSIINVSTVSLYPTERPLTVEVSRFSIRIGFAGSYLPVYLFCTM